MKLIKIKLVPSCKEIEVATGSNLLQSLLIAGVNIFASCGGRGVCGKCKVKILNGKFITESSHFINEDESKQNIVLACKTQLLSDTTVEILQQTTDIKTTEDVFTIGSDLIRDKLQKKLTFENFDVHPVLKVIDLKLTPPTVENYISDVERVILSTSQQEKCRIIFEDLNLFKLLPDVLRSNDWDIKVVLTQKCCVKETVYELFEVLPKKEEKKFYGIVVDVGTTTVVLTLVDLLNLEFISTVCEINKQVSFGADIISRIVYSEEYSEGLEILNQKIIQTINELIYFAVNEAKIDLKDIKVGVFSGNTTMIHFLLGLPTKYIRREPYIPVVNRPPILTAEQLGLNINPHARIYCLPMVASYIGGDIVAGVVACGIDVSNDICALLDLGTNGEIVVGNKDFLISAACSCGPAFEGIDISSGMLAVTGAIEDVKIINDKVEYKVIGNVKPFGICGSGLIGLPAELYKAGVIDRAGKFNEKLTNHPLRERVRQNNTGEYEFIVVHKNETATGKDITITESDIQNILRSKGAIFHGLHTLLKYLHLNFSSVKKIYISGGFGNYINIEKAQVLGLLPDVEPDKFVVAGNTSLTGAALFLLSQKARDRIYAVQQKMTYIDLSSLPMYMNEYSSSLFIPHTDLSLFPNVVKHLCIK